MAQPPLAAFIVVDDDRQPRQQQIIAALVRMARDFVHALEAHPGERIEVHLNEYALPPPVGALLPVPPPPQAAMREAPYVFPAVSPARVRQVAQLFRIVEILLDALRNGIVVTKRDIYYRDPALFGTQAPVDRIVEQLAASLGVERHELGVAASPRGLVCGNIDVFTPRSNRQGERRDAIRAGVTSLVPSRAAGPYRVATEARWLLVVEKEAVFRRLCDEQARPAAWLAEGVIITAKGYPDNATVAFITCLAQQYPELQISALVDGDPFGIDIWRTYQRLLSASLPGHPRGRVTRVGVRTNDFRPALLRDVDAEGRQRGLVPLSAAERVRATRLLRDLVDLTVHEAHWTRAQREEARHDLSLALLLGYKAEIEWLDELPPHFAPRSHAVSHTAAPAAPEGGLVAYLRARIAGIGAR